jgi:hypothetical protein
MNLSKAAKIWIDYHKTHSKKNTMRAYRAVIERFIQEFGDGPVEQVPPEQILTFLNRLTEGNRPYTKRILYFDILIRYSATAWKAGSEVGSICELLAVGKEAKRTMTISAVGSI